MLHTKFRGNQPAGSAEDFQRYHIWACRPSGSCDQHHVIRFSFPCTRKLSYKIWFRSAQYSPGRKSFNFSLILSLSKTVKPKVILVLSYIKESQFL